MGRTAYFRALLSLLCCQEDRSSNLPEAVTLLVVLPVLLSSIFYTKATLEYC